MELSNKNLTNIDLNLCLYCDKTFANNSDLENHVEREHKTILCKGKGSRKSERITKNHSSSENSPFPGCFHCNKKTLRTENLDTLFQHLLSSHKDVYFGCKCKIRTQDKVALANHKKICRLNPRPSHGSDENLEDQKDAKKSQAAVLNGDSKCDSLSETDDNISSASAVNIKILPTNAIHKKSDRSKLKNVSKNASSNERAKRIKSSSSSTISNSSSNRTGDDEYTIPLTRQKLKEPPRSGAIKNRPSSNKKTQKIIKTLVPTEAKSVSPISSTKVNRTKSSKVVSVSSSVNLEPIESLLKSEIVNTDFDEDFYSNIKSNIRLNLNSYVDGKYNRLQNRPVFDKISVQSSVACAETSDRLLLPKHENEIHEATNFELSTPFPALLTAEQYGFGDSNPNKHKRQITKNSWKWKWDLIKKYKYVNEGGKIVKKVKQITTGLKDLSQLDMWTQLSMRSRYENLNNSNEIASVLVEGLHDSLSTRLMKTQNIEQLNHILDKCSVPEINIEQLQQTIIKVEQEEKEDNYVNETETEGSKDDETTTNSELFSMLNLKQTNSSTSSNPMLSGEWARPRCYICVDCGLKFDLMKNLNDHKNSEHPYVVSAHYEIVGRENLEQHLYKNLFLPKKALQASGFARSLSVNSDSKSNETNEASTSSDNSSKYFADQKEKECSKCLKMIKYSNDNDIYKHILDCIEDRVWMQAKRRSKYRKSRRKSRKTPRKIRLSVDQKKSSSVTSPITKDNTEVEATTFIEPNPKIELPRLPEIFIKPSRNQPLIAEKKEPRVLKEQMNIKSFFRVSKSTPVPMPKLVVQMLEIPNGRGSLKNSLRSSASKVTSEKNSSHPIPISEPKIIIDVESTLNNKKIEDLTKKEPSEDNTKLETFNEEKVVSKNTLIPLTIATPEKCFQSSPINSPTSMSLISPTSNVPKKKKKLNDCIAMLTCKIQAQLGVDFFHDTQPEPLKEPTVETPNITENLVENLSSKQETLPLEIKPLRKLSSSFQIASLINESSSFQEDVIDLSIKKKVEDRKVEDDLEIIEDLTKQQYVTPIVIEEQVKSEPILELKQEEVVETKECEIVTIDIVEEEPKPVPEKEPVKIEILTEVLEEISKKNESSKEEASVESFVEKKIDTCEVESFKISIPKEKIPNLRDILDQYQMITVNNIKISESERRAFEEQKNRILKILNKTNSLTRKITNRKVSATKTLKKKAPMRKASAKTMRKRPNSKVNPDSLNEKDESKNGNEVSKIEEVIKTTNRIRCRRLSVVVDPIINLSSFQHKNRKMRLTNNSQQNGFYELLAASEKLFPNTDTSVNSKNELSELPLTTTMPQEPEEPLNEEAKSVVEKELNEPTKAMTKTRAAKTNAVKELAKLSGAFEKDNEKKKLEKPKVKEVKNNSLLLAQLPEEPLEVLNDSQPIKKGRVKKQNVENIESPIVLLEKLENVAANSLKKPERCNQSKGKMFGKTKRISAKTLKKNSLPLEEIHVEQSLKPSNIIDSNEVDLSDVKEYVNGESTEVSLLPGDENEVSVSVSNVAVIEATDETEKIDSNVKKDDDKLHENIDSEDASVSKPLKKIIDKENGETEESPLIIETLSEMLSENDEDQITIIKKIISSPIPSRSSSENLEVKGNESFTINEDSFFNDDLDNDPSDKINDIVNNIINSSEFQIDSDNDKANENEPDDSSQVQPNCDVCKKTFRNEKVFQKHCTTSTHAMKVQRKSRGRTKERTEMTVEKLPEKISTAIVDEAKVFRTKGALKIFDQIVEIPVAKPQEKPETNELKIDISQTEKMLNANDDKLYYEFKMEKKPEDMTPKDKDQLFDSLFNSLEAKVEDKTILYAPKLSESVCTPQDSEVETSSASWDLKPENDVEWEGDNTDNVTFATAIKERYPKKFPVKINKLKDTAVSIPTKSLIMGKIFKKHRDREKQKTPQADAPNNKPGIKNSLDEIFDHLKNSADIDDKVLTCPSPKTLLKSVGGSFSNNSSNTKDMLETASQSNNNNNNVYKKISEKEVRKVKEIIKVKPQVNIEAVNVNVADGTIGQRKSRRRCAIKAKTFAETWSSDEYEELHDTEDIISIINEIEKRESVRKKKMLKAENHFLMSKDIDDNLSESYSVYNDYAVKTSKTRPDAVIENDSLHEQENSSAVKKKSVQVQLVGEKLSSSIRKRRPSLIKDGHKSDEERFTVTKDFKPTKPGISIKKRRMSCFVPSTTSFDEPKEKTKVTDVKSVKETRREETEIYKKANENVDLKTKPAIVRKSDSEKSFKNSKKLSNLINNSSIQHLTKKKLQKHRKRPRNKVKNIAYDSDSDFELNLNKKSKALTTNGESSSSAEEDEADNESEVAAPKSSKLPLLKTSSKVNSSHEMTMIKEPKLLPNDLKQIVLATSNFKAAIPEDIYDPSQTTCNRTKRQSSEKLYYWSSSSSESEQEQGDTADGDNEDSVIPHQPEQHGWIVGDSHKKLVTLLAHAKIKNKIN